MDVIYCNLNKTLWMKTCDSCVAAGFTEISRAQLLTRKTPWDEDISPLPPTVKQFMGLDRYDLLGLWWEGRLQF